ncbi:MAG: bifunctional nuclease family protein [Muribaculaceae bacterium]|nr:bifunctional nuclease family protein [Muribaculaceae bacterium]
MEGKIELKVLGITRNQVQSGAYALLLEEVNGSYRIPIVLGTAEAQAIAVKLEGVVTPRPMTHDLFTTIFHAYGIAPEYVEIYSFEHGIFSSLLHLVSHDGTRTVIDLRTSDAIAIALRTGTPIYTTPEILERTGFVMDSDGTPLGRHEIPLESLPIERLRARLQQHVEREEYEQAAEIQRIIASKMQSE